MKLLKFQLTLIIQLVFLIHAFPQLNVNAYLMDARADIANSKYFDAMQKLDICIRVRPGEIAYYYRGICKFYLNDNIGAKQDLDEVISVYDPLNYDAFHLRSLVDYRLGDNEEAIKDINVVIAAQDNFPLYYSERSFYRLGNQDYYGAISDCNRALRMNFSSENLYLCKGIAENALNKFDSALLNYNIALKMNPSNEDIYVRIGMTYSGMNKYSEAIEEFNKALKIDSGSTLAYFNRAEANVKLNKNKEAMEDFNTLIKYDPLNALAYFDRGILEASVNNFNAAIEDFDKVLELNPKNIQALFNRAKLYVTVKHYQEALSDFNSTIELYPAFVEAYYERAKLKETLHDYEGAKTDNKLGQAMTEANRLRDYNQRTYDSATLAHLLDLNSDFNHGNQKLSDSVNINFKPIFCIALKSKLYKMGVKGNYPLFFKKNMQDYSQFYLTDNKAQPTGNIADTVRSYQSSAALLLKAIQETSMQLFNAAIKDYDKIIEQDSTFAVAYFARAVDICRETEMLSLMDNEQQSTMINKTYRVVKDPRNDKYQKALADFNKTIELEPDFAFAYFDRAYIKFELQDFSGAVSDYASAIRVNPDFADAYYNRGILLFCLNDKLNACQDFSKAGELGLTEAYAVIKLYCSQIVK